MKNSLLAKLIFLSVMLLQIHSVSAENIGTYGVVYPIAETDLLEFIKKEFLEWEQSGRLKEEEAKIQKRVLAESKRPEPVAFLTKTDHPTTFIYEPIFVLQSSIYDVSGHLLLPQGRKVNALDYFTLHETLLFFDADDQRQVRWALNQSIKYDHVKYILTNGNVDSTSKMLGRIYFDQDGVMSKKLGLKHIPSSVFQEGNHLKITEFNAELF